MPSFCILDHDFLLHLRSGFGGGASMCCSKVLELTLLAVARTSTKVVFQVLLL
jgi:hypothetical protein